MIEQVPRITSIERKEFASSRQFSAKRLEVQTDSARACIVEQSAEIDTGTPLAHRLFLRRTISDPLTAFGSRIVVKGASYARLIPRALAPTLCEHLCLDLSNSWLR